MVNKTAYRRLRQYLGLPADEVKTVVMTGQLAEFEPDLADRLQTDVSLVNPQAASNFEYVFRDEGNYEAFTDEWGIGWKKPKTGGFY